MFVYVRRSLSELNHDYFLHPSAARNVALTVSVWLRTVFCEAFLAVYSSVKL